MLFRFQQPHDQQHPQRRIAAGLVAQVIIDEPMGAVRFRGFRMHGAYDSLIRCLEILGR
jgi:hypothetical protein